MPACAGHTSMGGTYAGPQAPAAVSMQVGPVTARALVLTLPGHPGWAAWSLDGPVVGALYAVPHSELNDERTSTVPYRITAYDAGGRVLAVLASPIYAGPMVCHEDMCERSVASTAPSAGQP